MTSTIACNLLWLRPGVVGGTESYAVRLLAALGAHAPDVDVHAYVLGDAAETHQRVLADHTTTVAPKADAEAARRVALERTWLARTLRHPGGRGGRRPCLHAQ